MPGRIAQRLFVVGCSRSGTTLLQRLLAAHPRIYTFPETGLILRLRGMRHVDPLALLGLNTGKEQKSYRTITRHCKLGEDYPTPPRHWSLRRTLQDGIGFFDRVALESGHDIWLEKTPRHILHAGWIQRRIPDSTVIHIVRDGREVLASLRDRARKYPQFARQAHIGYGIRAWNNAIRQTHQLLGQPGHRVVIYEDLARNPVAELKRLCAELGIDYVPAMLEASNAGTYTRASERWKAGAEGEIRLREGKYESSFTEREKAIIARRLDFKRWWEILNWKTKSTSG